MVDTLLILGKYDQNLFYWNINFFFFLLCSLKDYGL